MCGKSVASQDIPKSCEMRCHPSSSTYRKSDNVVLIQSPALEGRDSNGSGIAGEPERYLEGYGALAGAWNGTPRQAQWTQRYLSLNNQSRPGATGGGLTC